MSNNQRSHHILNLRFKQLVNDKNIVKLGQCIQSWNQQTEWMRFLPEIFIMLTDVTIPTNFFTRRNLIYNIFHTAIVIKIVQIADNQQPNNFYKNLQFIIRIISTIFSTISSKKNVGIDDQINFHKQICKFLAAFGSNNSLNLKSLELEQQKVKLVETICPGPTKKQAVEFIYPDLLLWYQFFIRIKMNLTINYLDERKAIEHLAKIRSQIQFIKQPVLLWVYLYSFVQETLKIFYHYSHSSQIEQVTISYTKIVIKIVCQKFAGFIVKLERQLKSEQDCQNIFRCMIRFNIISVIFCFFQKISKISINMGPILQYVQKAISVLLQKCKQTKNEQHQGYEYEYRERIFKYQSELSWMAYQIDKKIQLNFPSNSQLERHIISLEDILQNQYQNNSQKSPNLSTELEVFEKLLSDTIQDDREQILIKFSQKRRKPQLIKRLIYLVRLHPAQLQMSVKKVLNLYQTLKLQISLLTQYHLGGLNLILWSIKTAQEVVEQLVCDPQSINSELIVQIFRQAVSVLSLNLQNTAHHICSFCTTFQNDRFCPSCGQACFLFVYIQQLPHYSKQFWEDYVTVYEYFVNNEMIRVKEQFRETLASKINPLNYYKK